MQTTLETAPSYETPGLNLSVRPYFNLEPGYYYSQAHPDISSLEQLPFVPSQLVDLADSEVAQPTRGQFPVERIISTERPMENWGASGEQKIDQHGVSRSTGAHVVEFLNRGNYKQQDPPIRIVPFVDNRGEVWGVLKDGNHRVMAAKLAGERTVDADVYSTDPSRMGRYHGDVIEEVSRRGVPLYDPAFVPEALRDLPPNVDIRDAVASTKSDAAWSRFFSQ